MSSPANDTQGRPIDGDSIGHASVNEGESPTVGPTVRDEHSPQSGSLPHQSVQPIEPVDVLESQLPNSQRRVRKAETAEDIEAATKGIEAERISARHLRRALYIANFHELSPKSEFDAVRLLREAGIDPFSLASAVRTAGSKPEPRRAAAKRLPRATEHGLARLPGDVAKLPQRIKPAALPATKQLAEVNRGADALKVQQGISSRRRRALMLMAARVFAFVLLPTFVASWYFYFVATPMYSVRSEATIQDASSQSSSGSLGGLFSGTALATSSESIAVLGYLQSKEALARLDADLGFRKHFQGENIDRLQRLAPDSTQEAAYKLYKKFVKVSFDSTEGIIRMDVIATDPKVAAEWSRQLLVYAEEKIDQLNGRLREDQMRDAQESYDAAQAALTAAQRRLIEMQTRYKVISSETEVGMIAFQINALESQITQERLSLTQMESNPEPNPARTEPVKRRLATLQDQVAELRTRLTDRTADEPSLAWIQGQLAAAQEDLKTRQLMLEQSLQTMETSRIEASRQVRYLSLSVHPIPPDEPTYPRAFENTAVAMFLFMGIYIMLSMTATILRQQVTS